MNTIIINRSTQTNNKFNRRNQSLMNSYVKPAQTKLNWNKFKVVLF